MRRTIKVTLADAPTDVLVWLTAQEPGLWHHAAVITDATAPADATSRTRTTHSALALLLDAGYIAYAVNANGQRLYRATKAGRDAVAAARASDDGGGPRG